MTISEPNPDVEPTGEEPGEFTAPAEPHPPLPDTDDALEDDTAAAHVSTVSTRLRRIYVNDHRAAATAGLALMRRCERQNSGSVLGDVLRALVAELEEDERALAAVASSLGITPDPLKSALARLGEVVGRLKTNGRLTTYSPTSRLLELEALMAGIDAKRSLWRSLESAGVAAPEGVDYVGLGRRAADQHTRLEPHHREAARSALATAAPRVES